MTRRRPVPLDLGAARSAAADVANEKARNAPHTLTTEELDLIPGRLLLDLGNAGRLVHLGIGLPVPRTAAPKTAAARAPQPQLTDAQMSKMSAEQVRKAAAAGLVPRIGARRRTWGQR